MRIDRQFTRWMSVFLLMILVLPGGVLAQESGEAPAKAFSQEQLDQLLAPIALYPDSLLTQVLMASTYPLEVVKADNWAKQNKDLKGDALAKALEKQEWDPSVKSLVNFPQVLQGMSDKLDWTQKLGDAFLAQQKDVMATVQTLRQKAWESGHLKSSKEQTVTVDQEKVIVIESASPQVVYVPAYNPTVVYGTWAYPAYPPYYVYPPPATAAFSFVGGVALGAAWGYAWGHSDWHGGDVDVNVNRNANFNQSINRGRYSQRYQGGGRWQHDAGHRQGVAYRDNATARRYGQGTARTAPAGSGARGYGDRGGQAGAGRAGSYGGGGRGGAFSGSGSGSFDRSASQRGVASRSSGGGGGGGFRGGGGGGGFRGGGGGRGGGRR